MLVLILLSMALQQIVNLDQYIRSENMPTLIDEEGVRGGTQRRDDRSDHGNVQPKRLHVGRRPL